MFYETFTTRQAERGHPRNPAFLLKDGELAELMAPFTVLRSREGESTAASSRRSSPSGRSRIRPRLAAVIRCELCFAGSAVQSTPTR